METKFCPKCKQEKPIEEFYFRSGKASKWRRSYCKICDTRIWREPREKTDARRKQRCDEWRIFLAGKYGLHPKCEMCGKKLNWNTGNKEYTVMLDHRLDGKEPIQEGFISWAQDHPLNEENIIIFEACEFGVLCRRCNITIPTKGRKEWFQRLSQYLNRLLI